MKGGPIDPTLPSGADAATTEVHADEAYCSACNQSFPSDTKVCPNDGARLIRLAAQRDDLIGRVLDERYEIRAPLGKGGMGTVYRGWQLSVDREVAIKVIHPKLSNDRSAVKRFLREARLASRLSQPNIVNVYDFGQSDGVLYLVMELLRGHTLASELGNGRRINPRRTIVIASQLCDALEAAHAQGIVHRDLKPSNIVILDDPPGRDLIKVLDFGLAKSLIQDSGSVVTNTDALLGTPLYMAPEQIEGRVSDQRADLYSLGCMLYEMLSGKPPFVDNAVSAVLARHMHDSHKELPAHVPSRLRSLIDNLLAKNPDDRVQSAGDVRRILEEVRDSAPSIETGATAPAMVLPDTPDTIPDTSPALAETAAATPMPAGMVVMKTPESIAPTPDGAKPRRYAIVAFFAVIPLAAAAFVMFGSQASRDSTRAPEPARDRASEPDLRAVPQSHLFSSSGESSAAGSAVTETKTAVTPDAGIDAPGRAMEVPIAAGVKSTSRSHERPKPRARPDAGTQQLPDIDFIDVNKK
jgi:serine/threonine-protein kinase